jgi:biotin carboxylase
LAPEPQSRGNVTGRTRRLLVLGAGPAQLGLLQAARRRGLFVIALDRDPSAPGFEFADRRAVVSTEDEPAIGMLAAAEELNGVIAPGIDWPVAIAARVAARLGLSHPLSPETAALAVSKQRQRERLAAHDVPQPRWRVVREAPDDLELPVVVKPPDRQGQKGLTLVREQERLAAAVAMAVSASRTNVALVEELVDGPELTVNAFSTGGVFHPLTVTDRITARDEAAFGVALAHAWPSEHETEGAIEVARAAATALGVENGPTYTQVVLGPDGPKVMELAARLGGGHDAELCDAALGVDLNGLALSAALGEPLEVPRAEPRGGAVVKFLVASPGTLESVRGIEEANAQEGIVGARVYRRPGWVFAPLRRGSDRAGFVLATGNSRDDALAKADRAAELIRFETAHAEALVP